MTNKINIVELLQDCPKGTKLYSPLCGECELNRIHNELKKIVVSTSDGTIYSFYNDGKYFQGNNGECMLFPSKENRDWNKFHRPFKDGDVIYVKSNKSCSELIGIYKDENSIIINDYCSASIDGRSFYFENVYGLIYKSNIDVIRLATEKEKQKLFDTIKTNGYYWNTDNKTLEPLLITNFKVGDKIKYKYGKNKDGVEYGKILSITGNTYDVAVTGNMGIFIPVKQQNDWELVSDKVEPLFKVGDEIVKKNGITNSFIVQSVSDEYYGLQLPDKSGVGVLPTKDQDDWMVISSKPKFKVGDEVYNKKTDMVGTISKIYDDEKEYMVNLKKGGITFICFENENCWDLVSDKVEPKFKVGDRIRKRGAYIDGIVVEIDKDYYYKVEYKEGSISYVNIKAQNDWELVVEPKFKVGDKIKKKGLDDCYTDEIADIVQSIYTFTNGNWQSVESVDREYELVPNKFDISSLKPFDRILVRTKGFQDTWIATFFSHKDDYEFKPFWTTSCENYQQCIPYEGNENLLGTTKDCNDFYKNW